MSLFLNNIYGSASNQELTNLSTMFMLKTSNNESRVTYVLKMLNELHFLPTTQCKVKNSVDSAKFKNEGNRIFLSKRDATCYMKAWELYSKSIAFAPNNSEELALAFANRSAVLFNLCKYSEAVEDMNKALKSNCADHLKAKLCLRKIECLALLGSSELSAVYEETLNLLKEMSLDNLNQLKFIKKVKEVAKLPKEKAQSKFDPVLPTIVPQSEIPCATEALAVRHNTKFGRHIVSTRKIKTGEILAVEEAYSTMLEFENMYTHCAHCLEVAWASIPCEHCVYVLYCSENCRELAWNQYHDIECLVTGHLLDTGIEKASDILSMRLVILAIREFGTLEKLKAELIEVDSCSDPRTKGFSATGNLESNIFRSVYGLLTNTEKCLSCLLFLRAHYSAVIFYYMATRTTFFGKAFESNDFTSLLANKDVTFVGGLILRLQEISATNSHFIEEMRNCDLKDRAIAAFPFHSLFNHSCCPNVSRVNSGKHMVLFAVHPIEENTQIFDGYGFHFDQFTRSDRQEKLQINYHFKCQCTPCQKNWPMSYALPSFYTLVKSSSDIRKIQKAVAKLTDYTDMEKERISEMPNVLSDLTKMVEVLMQHVPLYCLELVAAINTLKHLFIENGNTFYVPKLKKV